MNKLLAFLLLSMGVPALAATYTVAAGASAATIQATVNTAGTPEEVAALEGNATGRFLRPLLERQRHDLYRADCRHRHPEPPRDRGSYRKFNHGVCLAN